MKSSSKWLAGFGAVLLTMIVIAVVLVLVLPGGDDIELPPEDTPEGVVLRYFQAINHEEYDLASEYLSEEAKEKYPFIRAKFPRIYESGPDEIGWKVSILDINKYQESADVFVEISVFRPEVSFYNPVNSYQETYELFLEDDVWKIDEPARIPWYIW